MPSIVGMLVFKKDKEALFCMGFIKTTSHVLYMRNPKVGFPPDIYGFTFS